MIGLSQKGSNAATDKCNTSFRDITLPTLRHVGNHQPEFPIRSEDGLLSAPTSLAGHVQITYPVTPPRTVRAFLLL
jgi:hypothetical protein